MKLKIKTLSGYHDADEIMLHAIMQILVNFIEVEKPDEHIDWDDDDDHRNAWNIITSTYNWWKKRPFRTSVLDGVEIPDDYLYVVDGHLKLNDEEYPHLDAIFKVANEQERTWYQEDTEMMQKIISVREYMWT